MGTGILGGLQSLSLADSSKFDFKEAGFKRAVNGFTLADGRDQ